MSARVQDIASGAVRSHGPACAVRAAGNRPHLAARDQPGRLVAQRQQRRAVERMDHRVGRPSAADPAHLFDGNIFYPARYAGILRAADRASADGRARAVARRFACPRDESAVAGGLRADRTRGLRRDLLVDAGSRRRGGGRIAVRLQQPHADSRAARAGAARVWLRWRCCSPTG